MKKKTEVKPKTIAGTLKQAFALLGKNGEHWTQSVYARSEDGRQVSVVSPEAVAWCAYGAIEKVDGRHEKAAIRVLATVLRTEDDIKNGLNDEEVITTWNDDGDWDEVATMYRHAIAKAEKKK